MTAPGPIGMFDSGFGGLTVARAVFDLLPGEDVVYIGDTGRYPYGPKLLADVRKYAAEIAQSLVDDFGVKAIIVACNTATAAGLDELRLSLDVPIVDVIEPGARSLVDASASGRAGVIATVGTIGSGAYLGAVAAAAERAGRAVTLTSAACPGFVEFVERGQVDGDEVTVLAERLLAPICAAGVDALLLGCTHYPFLARVISDVVGHDVTLVSSADETAFAARQRLGELGLLRPDSEPDPESDSADHARAIATSAPEHDGPESADGRHRFLSSGDLTTFQRLGSRLLPELTHAERWPRPAS